MNDWFWNSKTPLACVARFVATPIAYPFLLVGLAITACFNPQQGPFPSPVAYWAGRGDNA